MDILSLNSEISLPIFSLNSVIIISLGMDTDLTNIIRINLEEDEFINSYLFYLRDPTSPRDDDITEFLRDYSLSTDGLVLRDGLIYIPTIDEIKMKIL